MLASYYEVYQRELECPGIMPEIIATFQLPLRMPQACLQLVACFLDPKTALLQNKAPIDAPRVQNSPLDVEFQNLDVYFPQSSYL